MLTQVVLQTANPMTFEIASADPDEIIILQSISGLSPADVTLFMGDFASKGGYYQGRRASRRFPVFNLKLNPDYANDIEVSDIREMLYRQFLEPQPDVDGVQVLLKDDRKPDRYFIGYTEKFPADIFDKSPKAQISMVCVDGMLKSAAETTDSNPGGWVSVPFDYEGSADTGVEVTLKVTAVVNQVSVENNGQLMKLVKPNNFAINDIVYINTKQGERRITLNGVDVMALLTADSKWISLNQASNTFNVYGTVASDGKVVATDYTYRAEWWGV
jgi:hypothetical protein